MSDTQATANSPTERLLGRAREQEVLGRLLDDARKGRGAIMLLHGEAGVGKSSLLDRAAATAGDFRLVRTAGSEGEMELAFAALQRLVSPLLDLVDRLPEPQQTALGVALGVAEGRVPSRFLVGLAVLGLLSEAAEEQPLLTIVDDAQWLDDSSAQVLAFIARRLEAERIVLLFAARDPGELFAGSPTLEVRPLGRVDSRALLESVLPAPVDGHVLDRIVLETRGNPLALLELPRGLTPAQLAGGFGLPVAMPLPASIEESFTRRMAGLSYDARRFLLLAAADSVGDPAIVWRAAEGLGIPGSVLDTLEGEDFLEAGPRIVFRHPLIRSAVYRSAGGRERRAAHRALADATDPQVDPDRRAWHLGQATPSLDEEVAVELERSAGRARARGGYAAVAAFLERAADLTPDPNRRAQRLLAAAGARRDAGDLDGALGLLAGVETNALGERERGRAQLLEAQIAVEQRRAIDAGGLFLSAATLLRTVDPRRAREAHLEALGGVLTNDVAVDGGAVVVAEAVRAVPSPPGEPGYAEVLLHAYANRLLEGYAAAAPLYAQALELALAADPSGEEDLGRRLSLSSARDSNVVALELWDDEALHLLAARQVQLARDTGALGHLEFALSFLARSQMVAGDLEGAAKILDEAKRIAQATGNPELVNAPLILEAWRGGEAGAAELIDATSEEASRRRWTSNAYARAVLYNGLGRYAEARDAAWEAMKPDPIGYGTFLIPELAEAASRTADRDLLDHAVRWLDQRTDVIESAWASGIAARVRALVGEGEDTEDQYRRSIEHLSGTRLRLELARSRLLYGEWLRRGRRRIDARGQLRTAFDELSEIGAGAFAARAKRELVATGERARRRTVETRDQLTPQEAQISRLAADGLTNREIAAQLFISPSTVEYHLRKVFRKVEVTSRIQLARRFGGDEASSR